MSGRGYCNIHNAEWTEPDNGLGYPCPFCMNAILIDKNARLREALERIASYGEEPTVTGSFDEPHSARIARAALEELSGNSGYMGVKP